MPPSLVRNIMAQLKDLAVLAEYVDEKGCRSVNAQVKSVNS